MPRQDASAASAGRRLLFFVSSMNAGGAERVAATLANAWAQRGDTVWLVMTHLDSHSSFYSLDPRVRCIALGEWMTPSLAPVLWRKWRAMRAIHDDFAPDVVLSFLTNVNVNVLWALRAVSTPILVAERTHPLYSASAGRLLSWLRLRLYGKAQRVILQTERAAEDFATIFTSCPVVVIPNPLPADLLQWAPRFPRPLAQPPQVVALGRLAPVKQFDRLIEAFARLPLKYEHWHLRIYGEGPQRDALQQQITQLGLQGRVHLPGNTTEPWKKLQQAGVFVLCSAYEGFPNALLEALYLGLPCLALDCPSGPAELSEQGRVAHLLPAQATAAQMSEALSTLLADEGLRQRLGRAAHDSVDARYRLEAVLGQWEALFEQVT